METLESKHEEQRASLVLSGAIGGFVLIVISIVFIIGGIKLGLGSPFRLGTGAFPFVTGLLLACLSVAICITEIRSRQSLAQTPDWISFMAITAALAVFASTADRFGLVPAAFMTVVVASLPDRDLSLLGKIFLGGVIAAGAWLLFIRLLNLPLKAFVGI